MSIKHMIGELEKIQTAISVPTRQEDEREGDVLVNDDPADAPVKNETYTVREMQNPKDTPVKVTPPEDLILSVEEIDSLQCFSGLIGNNPRAIKRL